MALNKNEIAQLLELYKAAVFEKDAVKFLSLYDTSSRVFDTWGVWVFEDLESRRPVIENWFGSLGDERVTVNFDDVQITGTEEIAVLTAVGTYAAISLDNKELRSMQNRFTWALKRYAAQWKIVHEHTSVPIANDLTAKLQRD
ncbi:hypothetical protein GCM10011613_23700 [Cellvibrio zantedeschiae]|uniref:SnoaL-like domain-containing protein n=1 Tax=Cellvibrio zantedeschiae TaxID=1237077 RepID=A0ABQ3B4N3_9GAMM|nr:nuclear transport factor 2 family protein [Cellvibrio zantedeschiae]GGY78330.1 hypothetical protein GCM10011613_23700 [Cellvibrio zantedeschiae]